VAVELGLAQIHRLTAGEYLRAGDDADVLELDASACAVALPPLALPNLLAAAET
jgi:hypothetical protein